GQIEASDREEKMTFLSKRKLAAGITSIAMLAGIFSTGFTYQPGIGNVYYETQSDIYDNSSYHEQLADHSANGILRTYFVNADIQDTDLKPWVFEGEVTGTYTMDTMISTVESQGYKVVAGINGDVYDMDTGTPKGLSIHDGKIKTSGYAPEYVISFAEDGSASLEKVDLRYTLQGTINVPVAAAPVADLFPPTDPGQPPHPSPPADPIAPPPTVYIPAEYDADIGYFNVPHGAAKALHLYNRQYAPSTGISEDSVEVILDTASRENTELTVGGTITATVVGVRKGNGDTPIGSSQLVLSTAGDSASAVQLAQLIPGSKVKISVHDGNGGNLSNSQEAIGVNHLLYDKGQYFSNGNGLGPRTILGIKPDGSLMLYAVDGRQPEFSAGFGLDDAAKHLVYLGCSTVVNMDGGGSTVMAARAGGVDARAVVKNSPSGQTQRRTTNGLLLVYDRKGDSHAAYLHTYPSQPIAMPGADIQLQTYASNQKYEPVPLNKRVVYSLDSDTGHTVDGGGLFTAGSAIGTAVIGVKSGNLGTTAKVYVQNEITFTPNVQNLVIDPGETFDIDVTAKFGYAPIASKDSLFIWSCDPVIGTIDANGFYQATNASGISGNIRLEYNGVHKTIPVQVGSVSLDFADTKTHWARDYIGRLAARGILSGMGNNRYGPDNNLTRAEFLAILANTVDGLDLTRAAPTGFKDVPAQEWYYRYVNWGFEKGIVRGIDGVTFAPNARVTREQMAVMLDNLTNSTDYMLPATNAGVPFKDRALISLWAAGSVNKIAASGLMGGYPDGQYKPQGNATRAEAATVVCKLIMMQ
ncbi:MAG: S-layer homology domain-containing protein, partial [Syntrophomonadaceae bacterium]